MMYKSRYDTVSVLLSLFCTVHCIILLLFLTTLPLLGFELLENQLVEIGIILLSALIGGYAVRRGFLKFHKSGVVIIAFVAGLVLMVAGNLLPFGSEVVLKLVGASFIIVAHIQNWRLSKKHSATVLTKSGIAFAE